MYILGISAYFHDSAACLLKDDVVIAAVQEERFTRIKNDATFPCKSIKYCLDKAAISLQEINYVVFYEKPFLKFERLIETYLAVVPMGFISFLKSLPIWIKDKIFLKRNIIDELRNIDSTWIVNEDNLLFTEHHQAHAASAFFPSPFKEALVLTIDGVGEWTTTSVWLGKDNQLEFLKEIKFPHSVGLLYSAFTSYLGFKVNADEYKVMGLAPYGQPVYADKIMDSLLDLKPDGSFKLQMKYFNYCTGLTMTNKHFDKLFGSKPREKDEEISTFHMNIACSIQKVTGEIIRRMLSTLSEAYPETHLCMAGGVALNCVISGKILQDRLFKELWIQPAAGDSGGALGAAYFVYYQHLNNKRKVGTTDKMQNALLGPSFSTSQVIELLKEKNIPYKVYETNDFYKQVAAYIDQGKIIGWFKGCMEFGPRALGARSILADSRNKNMQSLINLKVKFRESFRPFAPAILEEEVNQYFSISQSSPYMLLVDQILEKHRISSPELSLVKGFDLLNIANSTLPAVTHVDFSARIQTVNKGHPDFYRLLSEYFILTGCPAIVNTSFNVKDEPIVCTPAEALRCFLDTGLDILAIENIIVTKKDLYLE